MSKIEELFDMTKVGPQVSGEGSGVFPGGFVGGEYGCVVGGGCGKLDEQRAAVQSDAIDMGGAGGGQIGGYRKGSHHKGSHHKGSRSAYQRRRATRRYSGRKQRGGRRRATTQKRKDPFFLKLRVTGGISLKQRGR